MVKKQSSRRRSGQSTRASQGGTPGKGGQKIHKAVPSSNRKRSLGETIGDRLNEFADALESGEDLSAKFTCRKVVLNLAAQPYDPSLVKRTRAILSVSQGIFAQFLGVSVDTVQSWESGINTPSDMACRFMDEIRHNPRYWRERLMASVSQRVEQPTGV